MVECVVNPKLDLSDVLKDFGPKQQQICENSMLHPSITAVISALVNQVRSQNDVINELVKAKTQGDEGGEGGRQRRENGKDSDDDGFEGYVKQRVQNIEDTLWGSESETKDGTSVSGTHVSEEFTRRLESLETQLESKIDLASLEDHKRKTNLLLKRYHEKQSELSNTDDNRAEIAKMAAEVLSVASSATESISESISSDYQYMVKSLEVVRSDLTFVVENLYGLKNLAGSSRVVISPSRNKTGFSKDEVDIEEMSKRLRSAIVATTSGNSSSSSQSGKRGAKASVVTDTKALHEKMKAVLDLLDRQQGRTTDLEDKFRVSENILSDHEERIIRLASESPATPSTSPDRGISLYVDGKGSPASGMSTPTYSRNNTPGGKTARDGNTGGDDEANKIFKLQMKDMHSRIDAVVAQVESATALNKKPTSVKAINQKLDKMEERIGALGSQMDGVKKDQDAFRRKVTLVDEKHRKVASEKVKTLASQVTKHSETSKMADLRVDRLEKELQAKLKQCKIDVAALKKHHSDRPGLRESSAAELGSKVRLLEAQVEDLKTSLESSKKRNTKLIHDKIKGLSDQTAKQFEAMQDVPAKIEKLEAKAKEGLSKEELSSKKFLSKAQGKSFITAEVKVLKEYIESRWNDIAGQLKESIQITKESIRVSSKPEGQLPASSGENNNKDNDSSESKMKNIKSDAAKYQGLEILAKDLQTELACQSETQKEIQMRLFGLEGKYEATVRNIPPQRGESALISDVMKWKNLIDQQYNKLADQVEDYIADSKTGLKAARAIEERLESLILFLQEKLKPEELAKIVKKHYAPDSQEVEKKLTAFHRTVLKMANFDDICVSEIASLTNRMQVVEAKSNPQALHNDFHERLSAKADLATVMDLNKSLKEELTHALEHKVDWKIFLTSQSKSPYKYKVQL